MSLYPYTCITCGHEEDFLVPVDDRNELQPCTPCGAKIDGTVRSMKRRFHAQVGIKIGKGGIMRVPGHHYDGVGRIHPVTNATRFGVAGRFEGKNFPRPEVPAA